MPPLILTVTSDMLDWLNSVTLFGEQATDDRVRRLQPMVPADVCRYIAHCMKAQGHSRALIPPSAVTRIAVATRGLPGPISRFCDELLTLPTVRKGSEITAELIASLTAGLATLQPDPSPKPSDTARAPEATEAAEPSTVELPPAASYATTKPAWEDMSRQGATDVPPLRRFTAAESAWADTDRHDSADVTFSALSGRGTTATPSPFMMRSVGAVRCSRSAGGVDGQRCWWRPVPSASQRLLSAPCLWCCRDALLPTPAR
ncbi:hypothetical protein [Defluviicoccus vanus]|uniref:Uncharacterized protein n=1 Tax=Defluviicoccus vanus TaxID=111831 RepID=A0A7H1N1M6_9PROT|nr:hypothetical protein [Defluviicoccus vanus]QNT69612.1 hypothetical protein HQ394_10110 [Defluviicoccus vanus]